MWAFWSAAGLAAAGGVAPLVLGGTSSRVSGVIIPFGLAAVALGACALFHSAGKATTSLLYFASGLGVVYGILSLLAVPLSLTVIGTCAPGADVCGPGLQRPMSEAENTGLGFAVGMGIVALTVGFFGLATLYRQRSRPRFETTSSTPPPLRRIPPVASPETRQPEQAPAERVPVAAKAEPRPDLFSHEEEPELPAHDAEEMPELPAHETSPPANRA